jgi:hypothetical protein
VILASEWFDHFPDASSKIRTALRLSSRFLCEAARLRWPRTRIIRYLFRLFYGILSSCRSSGSWFSSVCCQLMVTKSPFP